MKCDYCGEEKKQVSCIDIGGKVMMQCSECWQKVMDMYNREHEERIKNEKDKE